MNDEPQVDTKVNVETTFEPKWTSNYGGITALNSSLVIHSAHLKYNGSIAQ